MNMHVVFRVHTPKVHTRKAGVETRRVASAHITHTRLRLQNKKNMFLQHQKSHIFRNE